MRDGRDDTGAVAGFQGATPDEGVGSMRIAMVSTGYVGLVSGACIADFGHM